MLLPCIIFLVCAVINDVAGRRVSPDNTLVWGPGLRSDFVVPVRYFYIQAVDTKGVNFTQSVGSIFEVDFVLKNRKTVRLRREVIDRHDGTYLARFRLFESYKISKIMVSIQKKLLVKEFEFTDTFYTENCVCPQPKGWRWMRDMGCPASYEQIDRDLQHFPKINIEENAKLAQKILYQASCHYSIIDNKVYRKCFGEINDFKMFSDAWLLSLTRKVRLPDMELFTNLGDWPLIKHTTKQQILPVLSWCGSDDTYDIVWPTYDIAETTMESFGGRAGRDIIDVQKNVFSRWVEKEPIAFFRGRDSNQQRVNMVEKFKDHKDFDVGITRYFFFEHDEKRYGGISKTLPFYDFFKYKYQLNIDGTVAAYRFPYLLAGNSLVLKQHSKYYEYFYHQLKPMQHYIPLEEDLSDLEEKVQWAKEHDLEAEAIAQNGRIFAQDNLLADQLYCYTYLLLKAYAKRQVGTPKVRKGMELVRHPIEHFGSCNCEREHEIEEATSETDRIIDEL